MQKELLSWNQNKTRFIVFALIAMYLVLFLPFWSQVLLGFLFASACAPMVNFVRKKFHARRTKVAVLTLALSLAIFIGFVALIVLQLYSQVYDIFQDQATLSSINNKIGQVRDQIVEWANSKEYLRSFQLQGKLDKAISGLSNSLKNVLVTGAQWFVSSAPAILLNLFMFIVAFGAFLVIQPRMWTNLTHALRLGHSGKEHFQRFEKICGLALGSVLLTAFVQALLATFGSAIAGFDGLFVIFSSAFFLAMIPVIGAGAVPVLLTVVSFVQGNTSSGIIMLVTSLIVGVSDNILRAWLFSRAAESNAAISLITLIGGVTLFGFPGLFIAPVLEQLVMTYAFSEEGEPRRDQITGEDKK